MPDDQDNLLGDELYTRLWMIRREVEAGTADPETVERWEELRETITVIVDSLRAAILAAKPPDRDRAMRRWIQAFVDEHWPQATLH
ncbi:hypothetical protein [Caulobacter sp. FWC2]|uniref:hypothetical protein n=1 Tax=Caulobacter sp. FWC2 TaxID=69664 RepID=UPI001178872A|nr:hypothetical protein [Caulobacter sp. FWC2]